MNREHLEHELRVLKEIGFTHLDLRRGAASDAAVEQAIAETPAIEDQAAARLRDGLPEPADVYALDSLEAEQQFASRCVKCRLAKSRTQVVFGSGNPSADLMFVGEAPGRDEDLQGAPFVGRAGQLLTDIIKAMKLSRDEVYIANVIKCRPPENRNPERDELEACSPWIERQIDLIQPRVIVTLGKFAVQSLLGKPVPISAVRGTWQQYRGIKVMPTYHPAFLLRTPSAKKEVWTDMKKVMTELGIEL